MPVQYLSPQWFDAYNAALATDDALRKAVKGKSGVIQMVVADAPDGEVRYAIRVGDGTASATLGDAADAEMTVRQSYDTAAKLNKGELDGDEVFGKGMVDVTGKMTKMMQLRGPLTEVQKAAATIDTVY